LKIIFLCGFLTDDHDAMILLQVVHVHSSKKRSVFDEKTAKNVKHGAIWWMKLKRAMKQAHMLTL